MFYIVETKEQLLQLRTNGNPFIQIILYNSNYHPINNDVSLLYYRSSNKGYILPLDHSEAFSLQKEDIVEFLSKHDKIYCLDKKLHSYFIPSENLVDINFTILDQENVIPDMDCDTLVHRDYYRKYYHDPNINKIIPISKHYEKCECLYESIKNYIGKECNDNIYDDLISEYKKVEEKGILIDEKTLDKHFELNWKPYSIKDNIIHTYYNLYNLTNRPTNSFNGINFLALKKDNKCRESFYPLNDMFIEFDFDGYHLRLIADLIGYHLDNKESIHTILGRLYFDKEEITEEEYQQSKTITFKQIYGGIDKEYEHIEFFQKIKEYIWSLWNLFKLEGNIKLPTGRILHTDKNENLNPQKLFNYVIQNLETKSNVLILKEINKLLENKKSFISLIVYDSFLIDFSTEDKKDILLGIKNIINDFNLTSKTKYGKNYDSLVKTNYL